MASSDYRIFHPIPPPKNAIGRCSSNRCGAKLVTQHRLRHAVSSSHLQFVSFQWDEEGLIEELIGPELFLAIHTARVPKLRLPQDV